MDFGKMFELVAEVLFALKQAQSLKVGESADIDTPDVEVSYKHHHFKVTSITVEKVS